MLESFGGEIVYYGMEKYLPVSKHDSRKMHLACAREIFRRVNSNAVQTDKKYLLVFDEHSLHGDRVDLASTVFKNEASGNIYTLDHPYALTSKFHKCIQLADWISAILGRIYQYEVESKVWEENKIYHKKLKSTIARMTSNYSYFKARQKSLNL